VAGHAQRVHAGQREDIGSRPVAEKPVNGDPFEFRGYGNVARVKAGDVPVKDEGERCRGRRVINRDAGKLYGNSDSGLALVIARRDSQLVQDVASREKQGQRGRENGKAPKKWGGGYWYFLLKTIPSFIYLLLLSKYNHSIPLVQNSVKGFRSNVSTFKQRVFFAVPAARQIAQFDNN
jgi:hypothetical protein